MGPLVVLGDEATCAGFALAGVEALSPSPSDAPGAFARALASASMVVVTQSLATSLAPGVLRRAIGGERPIVVVMPDLADPDADAGVAARVRAVLGLGA